MTYDEIEDAALDLGPEDRSRLAEILLQSVSDSISIAWAVESLRRLQELEAGTASEIPLDEVLRRARVAAGQDS
jgi:hypothetical protein